MKKERMATRELRARKVGFFPLLFGLNINWNLHYFQRKITGTSAPDLRNEDPGGCRGASELTRVENRIQIGWCAAVRKPYI